MIEAALGDKEAAVTAGRRACELLPVSQDAITGADIQEHLAITYTLSGEKTLALEQLSVLVKIPSDLNYGVLRLDPVWDPLRNDPRFAEILASLGPRETIHQ